MRSLRQTPFRVLSETPTSRRGGSRRVEAGSTLLPKPRQDFRIVMAEEARP